MLHLIFKAERKNRLEKEKSKDKGKGKAAAPDKKDDKKKDVNKLLEILMNNFKI
jgi:hypothetical protein